MLGVWYLVFRICYAVSGNLCLEFGILVVGFWYFAFGVWYYLVFVISLLVSGSWYLVFGVLVFPSWYEVWYFGI